MQINKNKLIDAIIEQVEQDLLSGDSTVLEEILKHVPPENLLHSLPEEYWDKFESTGAPVADFLFINGFWKDNKIKFSDYRISTSEWDDRYDCESGFFFFGLSEEDVKTAIESKWETDLDFVITSYYR